MALWSPTWIAGRRRATAAAETVALEAAAVVVTAVHSHGYSWGGRLGRRRSSHTHGR